jgi:hypothetical protein
MDDFSAVDLAMNAEPAFYMPLQAWLGLGLMLGLVAIGLLRK